MRAQIVTGPRDQSTFQHKETSLPRYGSSRCRNLAPSWTNFVPGFNYNLSESRTRLTLSLGDAVQLEPPDDGHANGFQTPLKDVEIEEAE